MNFPENLKWGDQKIYPEHKISKKNYMYARHKPGSDWKDGDEYPDFSKIRSNQSFNWSAFSIPIWVRFNDREEYLKEYGVIGYSVETIRNFHDDVLVSTTSPYGVKHYPLKSNYSHCEMYESKTLITKAEKREFRLKIKHNCIKNLKPYEQRRKTQILLDYVKMYWHRLLIQMP